MSKKLTKFEEKVLESLQEERNFRSQELFGKNECELQIAELQILDKYMYDLKNPQWKPVVIDGYQTNYEVSNTGLVVNKISENVLSQRPDYKGYIRIGLFHHHKSKVYSVHRLVASAFIPNPDNLPQVNHVIRGDRIGKGINWVGNLEWIDNSGNQKHAYANGLHIPRRGTEHGHCKNTEEDVHNVCKLLEERVPIKEIAERLNVTRAFVIGIKYQGNWEDIRSQYNIPESNTYDDRTQEQTEMIDQLVKEGYRNRKWILSQVGLPDTKTNISYVKYRVRVHNNLNKIVKGSTTIKHSDVGRNTAS